MVIMSDVEAFGLRLGIVLLIVCLGITLFIVPSKSSSDNFLVVPDTVNTIDTVYILDTMYLYRTVTPDTVYVDLKDTIQND